MTGYEEPWGDEVGQGWAPIVLKCHKELKHLDPGYRISQIKEKFGGLRYYYDSSLAFDHVTRDVMDSVVVAAEHRCSHTCEVCGASGRVRHNGGWWKTLCDDHTRAHRASPANPYGVCAHTHYEGSRACVHTAWDDGYAAGLGA